MISEGGPGYGAEPRSSRGSVGNEIGWAVPELGEPLY
jgi:hypothetical protein